MEQRLEHYFKTYKNSNECFVTADGLIFHKATDASAHAATLADKRIASHTRAEVEAPKLKAIKPKEAKDGKDGEPGGDETEGGEQEVKKQKADKKPADKK